MEFGNRQTQARGMHALASDKCVSFTTGQGTGMCEAMSHRPRHSQISLTSPRHLEQHPTGRGLEKGGRQGWWVLTQISKPPYLLHVNKPLKAHLGSPIEYNGEVHSTDNVCDDLQENQMPDRFRSRKEKIEVSCSS